MVVEALHTVIAGLVQIILVLPTRVCLGHTIEERLGSDNMEILTTQFGTLCGNAGNLCLRIGASEVSCLYRHRWDIEVFFKWVKQNIVVKTLWGYSENAVRTHLWVAVIAYLIIARIKANYKSPYSITEVATLIRISALEKVSLGELITKPRDSVNLNQSVKELSLF